MKKIYWLTVCCLLGLGFTACTEEDDEKDKNNNRPDDIVDVTPNDSTEVNYPDENPGVEANNPIIYIMGYDHSEFYYENGKLTHGVTDYDSQFAITWNPLSIHVAYEGENEDYVENYTNMRVNQDGYVTSADYEATDTYQGETWHTHATFSAQYTLDGHIAEKNAEMNDEESTDTYNISYTWEDNNLTHIRIEEQYTEIGYGTEHSIETYEYTYDADDSRFKNSGIYLYEMWYATYDFMWYAGLLGKTTRNIPTSVTHIYEMDGEEIEKYTYQIVPNYNDDNAITSLEYRDPSGYTIRTFHYGYENGGSVADSTYMSKRTMDNGKKAKAPRLARFRK